ncbi:MAG: ABC transporter ATP-binding protein [Pseudomonadota bacterium]|nr:MAG: ABC transporter ATP-binding protein [Pseudomonadota bacterium]
MNKLGFRYPATDFELNIPEFSVARGEKVAVIGPSGSGKTTLLNLIAGILTPAEGSIRVGDTEVSALSDAARRDFRISRIGFVFQDFELLDYLNILDNILHPYRISNALRLSREVRTRAATLAEGMAIGDKLGRRPGRLSQGEKQRAAICRALLPNPDVILADEATGNLDPRNKGHILDLLFDSAEHHGATLLAVTHDHELLPHFDRVVDFQNFRAGAAA